MAGRAVVQVCHFQGRTVLQHSLHSHPALPSPHGTMAHPSCVATWAAGHGVLQPTCACPECSGAAAALPPVQPLGNGLLKYVPWRKKRDRGSYLRMLPEEGTQGPASGVAAEELAGAQQEAAFEKVGHVGEIGQASGSIVATTCRHLPNSRGMQPCNQRQHTTAAGRAAVPNGSCLPWGEHTVHRAPARRAQHSVLHALQSKQALGR